MDDTEQAERHGRTLHVRIPDELYRRMRHLAVERAATNAEIVIDALERCCAAAHGDPQAPGAPEEAEGRP